jgi:Ca2+-binding RTX toxin-like protein
VLPANVEDLFLTGDGEIDGTGNNLANLIVGNGAANRLDGGGAIDDLRGGDGDDTYVVDNVNDQVVEVENEGVDAIEATVTFILADHVENLALMGMAGIGATGNALANVLTGNAGANALLGLDGDDSLVGGDGNDTLDGGAGADTMRGGGGDDAYLLDNAGDVVIEESAEGTDVLYSAVSRTLGDHQENLILTGAAAIDGAGNELANQIIGNAANNVLTGLDGDDLLKGEQGADTLVGGTGSDLYYVDDAGDVVTELAGAAEGAADVIYASINLTLPENVERVIVVDVNALFITGNGLSNVFEGNNGNDTLAGGGGNDTLEGGGGKDRLDGGSGRDSMKGGAGDDTYIVDNTNDKVVETSNQAGGLVLPAGETDPQGVVTGITDTVIAAVNYTLGTYVEHLTLSGTAARATGNTLANRLTGNAGADTLSGAGGNDTLDGGSGDDLLLGGAGNDRLVWGGSVNDRFDGGSEVDTLRTSSSLNLTRVSNANIKNVEQIDLSVRGAQKLTLNSSDVLDLSGSTNTIKVLGTSADVVDIVGSFTRGAASGDFRTFQVGSGILLVDIDVLVT